MWSELKWHECHNGYSLNGCISRYIASLGKTFYQHHSESELLFLDDLVEFLYFLTEPEVFQDLLCSQLLLGQTAGKSRMFTEPSLVRWSPWQDAAGRAMSERLYTVSSPPAEDQHPGVAHMHTGIGAVNHDVMTSGRALKHSRLWSLWACNKSQETTVPSRNIYLPVFHSRVFPIWLKINHLIVWFLQHDLIFFF